MRPAALRGTGLHTGATTEATFLPAPAGQGIVFRRTDLAGKPEVPARLTEVEAQCCRRRGQHLPVRRVARGQERVGLRCRRWTSESRPYDRDEHQRQPW